MSNGRNLKVADLDVVEQPVEGEAQVVAVSVSYHEGGISYFDYKQVRRGFYLHVGVQAVEVTKPSGDGHPGFVVRKFSPFTGGFKVFLEEATRFNRKRLATLADSAFTLEVFPQVLTRVLIEHGLHLTDETKNLLSAAGMPGPGMHAVAS